MQTTCDGGNITAVTPDSKKRPPSVQGTSSRRRSEPTITLPATCDFARSHVANWTPPVPVTSESEALQKLKIEWKRQSRDQSKYDGHKSEKELLIVDLYDYEIYRAPESGIRAYELTSLHYLEVAVAKKLCFDGFICLGATKHYVQGVPIQDTSVEGYGDDEESGVTTYIQSTLATRDKKYDIWYRLATPAPRYKEFQKSFLWVAQLGKHIIDYLDSQSVSSVGLNDFREDFHHWLSLRFGNCADFQQWHTDFRRQTDFRVGVHAYIEYFYNQAFNLSNSKQLLAHPLWSECMAKGLTAVEAQKPIIGRTIATPEVYHCYKDMYFGEQIQKQRPADTVRIEQQRRKRKLGFAKSPAPRSIPSPPNICQPYGNSLVRVGDVVALIPDETDSTVWRNTTWEWLAYVQATESLKNGTQRLFVLWIYRHHETNIFKAMYPYKNEVFLSDNCNCTEGELLSTDIKGRYDIDWSPSRIDAQRFFVRQTYVTQDSAFVSLQSSHKTCTCRKEVRTAVDNYRRGDTAHVARTRQRNRFLDPIVIQHIDHANGTVRVRKLLRLERDCKDLATKARRFNLAANELVLTDDYEDVLLSCIQRRCFVKFVSKSDILNDRIPFTYNRGGSGDLWFLSMGLSSLGGEQNLIFLRSLPKSFNEGPNMTSPEALRGMSIFSGGGSLDRGLEEGGAVTFHSAVDFSPHAIHTQRANSKNPGTMFLFCGSVDDHFNTALQGNNPTLVPGVGEVDFIAAGSPCPGFSALQQNFLSEQSLRNASHISTFCSYVDLYRPLYGMLENVVNMASTRVGYEDQNVLSQVVASLVSMGYQCNQYIMDAWSYGSAQQRSRLILTIAAPGLEPIAQPWHTHARPYEETTGKSLGRLPNGERFGEREHYPTPFSYVPAITVDAGLPDIGNGILQTCIPFPDHRLPYVPTRKQRALVRCIPRQPPGSCYKDADQRGLIPTLLRDPRTDIGKAYTRIKATGLVPCITTSIVIRDSRNGATLHWDQHRSISVLEARRTQGYMDEEPIIGSLTEQYKIVGNGVDRKVAFSMGLALLQACQKNGERFTANGTTQNFTEIVDITSDAETQHVQKSFVQPKPQSKVEDVSLVQKKQHDKDIGSSVTAPARRKTDGDTERVPQKSVESRRGASVPNGTAAKPSETPLSQTRHSVPQNSAFFSRLSKSVAAGVGRLSLSNISTSSSASVSTLTPIKRSREEDTDAFAPENQSHSSWERPRKQPRISEVTSTQDGATSDSEGHVRKSVSSHRSGSATSSTSSDKTRYTRHSGLSVEYVPKHWNKRVEVETSGLVFEEEFV
jgi:DNA (cytosine-5)-methyltransferase 1